MTDRHKQSMNDRPGMYGLSPRDQEGVKGGGVPARGKTTENNYNGLGPGPKGNLSSSSILLVM